MKTKSTFYERALKYSIKFHIYDHFYAWSQNPICGINDSENEAKQDIREFFSSIKR